MTPPSPIPVAPPPLLTALRLGACCLLLAIAIFKTIVTYDPFPAWSGDPLALPAPIVGLTPTPMLALDALTLLAAFGGLAAHARLGGLVPRLHVVFFSAGAAVVAFHAFAHGGSLDDLLLGASWVAALATGLAVASLARHPTLRRLAAAAALAAVIPLVAKGLLQVLVEHPQTVAMFRANTDAILNANGWTRGSPIALAYERRLIQPEATGWFGLANVFATLAAGAAVALVGLSLSAHRRAALPVRIALAAGAAAALVGVALAGSKGGYAAATLGLIILALPRVAPATLRRRLAPLLGPAVVAGVLSLIALRGVIGERLGELSLLFRAFYIEAAIRIAAGFPVAGVGPAGFKDAYLLAKNPLSPEDVASPHSLLFDYAATLGLGGLALGALWLTWVGNAGRAVLDRPAPEVLEDPCTRDPLAPAQDRRALFLILALPTVAAAFLELPAATPESAGARLAGLAAAVGVGLAILRLLRDRPAAATVPLAAAGLAVAAHAQIELTPVTPGAAAWCMLLIGLAAAGGPPPRRGVRPAALAILGIVGAATLAFALPRVGAWEAALRRAYDRAIPIATLVQRRADVEGSSSGRTSSGETLASLVAEANALGGTAFPASARGLDAALDAARTRALVALPNLLRPAAVAFPTHLPTARSLGRVQLDAAVSLRHADPAAATLLAQTAVRDAEALALLGPPRAGAFAWLASARRARDEIDPAAAHPEAVLEAFAQAAAAAPREPGFPATLSDLAEARADHVAAARWARRALDLDAALRLDPLKQFAPADRVRLERRATPPPAPGTP